MLWISLFRVADTLSRKPKIQDQKAKHLQTEEKVFDSPLLRNIVLKALHRITALLARRDLQGLQPSLLLQEVLSSPLEQIKSGFDHTLLYNPHGFTPSLGNSVQCCNTLLEKTSFLKPSPSCNVWCLSTIVHCCPPSGGPLGNHL